MSVEYNAADQGGPLGGVDAASSPQGSQIAAITLSTSSVAYDLQDADYFGSDRYTAGIFVEMLCSEAVYYFWSNSDSDEVDETAADGVDRGKQCAVLLANLLKTEIPRGRYLIAKAATGTPILRIWFAANVPVK